jgi:hypothetical protein
MADLWELHDKRDFVLLKKRAQTLCLNLGYGKKCEQIAQHIAKAYQFHAEIDDTLIGKQLDREANERLNLYQRMILEELTAAFENAGARNSEKLAFHHTQWWINFLKKNITKNKLYLVPTFWHLFMEQHAMIGNVFTSFDATLALSSADRSGHSKRSRDGLEKGLERYWSIMLKNNKKNLMF